MTPLGQKPRLLKVVYEAIPYLVIWVGVGLLFDLFPFAWATLVVIIFGLTMGGGLAQLQSKGTL